MKFWINLIATSLIIIALASCGSPSNEKSDLILEPTPSDMDLNLDGAPSKFKSISDGVGSSIKSDFSLLGDPQEAKAIIIKDVAIKLIQNFIMYNLANFEQKKARQYLLSHLRTTIGVSLFHF